MVIDLSKLQQVHVTQDCLPQYWDKLFECFRETFGYAPWREGWKCDACFKAFGFDQVPPEAATPTCDSCNKALVLYYGEAEKKEMLEKLLSMNDLYLSVMCNDNDIVAFYWGFLKPLGQMVGDFELDDEVKSQLLMHLRERSIGVDHVVMYTNEAGVIPAYRGNKLSQVLFTAAVAYFLNMQDVAGIMGRTSEDSPMYYLRTRKGFEVIHQFPNTPYVVLFLEKEKIPALL